MSDNYLKQEGVQIKDIKDELDSISEIYSKFYEGTTYDESPLKGHEIKSTYMEKSIQHSNNYHHSLSKNTAARYDKLSKHLYERVERKDFIGFFEKFTTHWLRREYFSSWSEGAYFVLSQVPTVVNSLLFMGIGSAAKGLFAPAAEGVARSTAKITIDIVKLFGSNAVGILTDGKVELAVEKTKGKKGQQEYAKGGKKLATDISTQLGALDPAESKALFKILLRVYKYYLPKINVHFGQCHDAYEDLFGEIFSNEKEPAESAELKEKKPEFKTCDDVVKFTEKVYRFYHEIYKLRQYMMPMLRFMRAITEQSKIWDDFWNEKKLWEIKDPIELLIKFDKEEHRNCIGTYFCYGPKKKFKVRPALRQYESGPLKGLYKDDVYTQYASPEASQIKNIEYSNKSKPHWPMVGDWSMAGENRIHHRTPWLKPTATKLAVRKDTWKQVWKKYEDRQKKQQKEYKESLRNSRKLKENEKKIKTLQRECVLQDKKDRIIRFVHAAKKSVNAGNDDISRRFEALVTDIGLYTEHKGIFGGMWRWTKHYFFYVKSKSKTTLGIVVLGFTTGIGVGVVIVTEVATAGLATPLVVAIGAGISTGWATLKFLGQKVTNAIHDKIEKKLDKKKMKKIAADWYEGDQVKRMRLNRNYDGSKKIVSHCMSTIKNYKRLRYFHANGEGLSHIKDCDDLAQYLWSAYKFQHHARKTIAYNRPMLDFVLTASHNLERWEQRFDDNIDRCMKSCYTFLEQEGGHKEAYKKHIKSCGKMYRKEKFRFITQLFKKKSKSNTADIDCRKSKFCYGPKRTLPSVPTAEPHACALRPMDLRVDTTKKDSKRRAVWERLKLMKQKEEQEALQAVSDDNVIDAEEEE